MPPKNEHELLNFAAFSPTEATLALKYYQFMAFKLTTKDSFDQNSQHI